MANDFRRSLTEAQLEKLKQRKQKSKKKGFSYFRLGIVILGFLIIVFLAFFLIGSVFSMFGRKENANSTQTSTPIVETKKEVESYLETENELVSSGENVEINPITSNEKIDKILDINANLTFSEQEKSEIYQNLPSSLQVKIDSYPESTNTILQYEKFVDDTSEIDISKDLEDSKLYDRKIQLPYFSQWDQRWGFRQVGNEFIAVSGCGPVALSMIYTGLTNDTSKDPEYMARYAFENGWYDASGGYPNLFTDGPRSLGLQAEYIDVSTESMLNALDEGKVVLALVTNSGIGDFTTGGHFIIISEQNENGDLIIYDPNSYSNTNTSWDVNRVMSQVKTLYAIWK